MKVIDNYIDKLMTSKPDEPLWNIEQIRQGKNHIGIILMVV